MTRSLCVFCGSSSGANAAYERAARQLGQQIADRRLRLVYGGGRVGLMGSIADAVLEAGGHVVGVIPQALADIELAHQHLDELLVVDSMHQRKALMAEKADAFIAMPGGFGTWEELCEIITWRQLGIHAKPIGVLNVEGYYDSLMAQFENGVSQQFIKPEHQGLIISDPDPVRLLERLLASHPAPLPPKIDEDQR